MLVRVLATIRGVYKNEVSQSRFFSQVISRRCSSSPPSLFSSSFPPVNFCFVTPMLDSARLHGRLKTPLNALSLLDMLYVSRVLVKTTAVRKRQA